MVVQLTGPTWTLRQSDGTEVGRIARAHARCYVGVLITVKWQGMSEWMKAAT